MSDRLILQALQTAVIEAVAQSSLPSLDIKMVGRSHTPVANKPWLEIVFIPNNIENEFWGDSKTYRGMFRLILHSPTNDKGAYAPMDIIESVASYFTKGKFFQNGSVGVRVVEKPNLTGVLESPPEMLFPVSIRYNYFNA